MNRTEVLALEVRQYVERGGTRLTLVPRLIGETEAARQIKGTSVSRARNRWGEVDVLEAVRRGHEPDVARRVIESYDFMRDAGARQSFGTGADPSVTMWLGERGDPDASNPIAVGFYGYRLAVSFRFLLDRRSRSELTRLADLLRQIPGARHHLEGIEEKDFRVLGDLPPAEVLASDQALEAFKGAVEEAVRPPGSTSTRVVSS